METKTCPDCGCTTTPNNYKRHIGSKQCLLNQQNEKSTKIDDSWLLENGKYQCPHCDKEYSKNGIGTHIWRTHGEGQNWTGNNDGYKDGRINARKGLTKENDEKTLIASLKFKEKYKNGEIKLNGCSSESHKKSISEGMKKAYKQGLAIGWSRRKIYENDIEKAKAKTFLYLGLFEFNNVRFLKIGTAKNGFVNRYNGKMYEKYNKVLQMEIETSASRALDHEQYILKELNNFKFIFPEDLGKFDGYSECFKIEALENLVEKLKEV